MLIFSPWFITKTFVILSSQFWGLISYLCFIIREEKLLLMLEISNQAPNKKATNRPLTFIAVLLATFMSAVEGTIVSTAMPAISGELGDFSLYSWVFSAYMLTMTITVLIYGKLADLFGRKPIIIFGIIVFLLGSILCGFATNMIMLIVFRFIQGIGAGSLASITTTIVGDIYQNEERGKVQGYLASVWGISAVLGPLIGGLLVDFVSWRYVFWINLPLGLLSLVFFCVYFHENIEKESKKVDYLGAVLLMAAVSSIMFVFVEAGVSFAWSSWQTYTLLSIFLLCIVWFVSRSFNVPETMIPLHLWQKKSIVVANIVALTTGTILIGISSYLPTFVQGVMEKSPVVAGFTLTTMSIGWPIASTIAGRRVYKTGFRKIALFGGASTVIGSILFILLSPEFGPIWAATGSFFIGAGMGFITTAFIVSIQTSVSWKDRGIATALFTFMRNLGNAVGAALLGGILNSRLVHYFSRAESDSGKELSLDSVNQLLKGDPNLSASDRWFIQEGLTVSLHTVYIVVGLFAVVSLLAILFYPKTSEDA